MKDIRHLLRDADPLAHEPGLPRDAIAALRRAVIAAADARPVRSIAWGRQIAMAACLTVMVVAGLVAAHRVPVVVREAPDPVASAGSATPTQIHFSTPGGTRIIWTLDPRFQLRETLK